MGAEQSQVNLQKQHYIKTLKQLGEFLYWIERFAYLNTQIQDRRLLFEEYGPSKPQNAQDDLDEKQILKRMEICKKSFLEEEKNYRSTYQTKFQLPHDFNRENLRDFLSDQKKSKNSNKVEKHISDLELCFNLREKTFIEKFKNCFRE